MAIKTDQSLLNDNKQENIQYPQNKIVINQYSRVVRMNLQIIFMHKNN